MRSRILLIVLMVTVIGMLMPGTAWGEEQDLAPEAKSAILLDADTGTVLFEKNSEEKITPSQYYQNYDPYSYDGSFGSQGKSSRMNRCE